MASISPNPKFDVEESCKAMRDAMDGMGTDESVLIEVLTTHNAEQRMEIREKYASYFGEDLIDQLKSELRDDFQEAVVAMMTPTGSYLAQELRNAMDGGGTDEKLLVDILLPRSNKEIEDIQSAYSQEHERDLKEDLENETRDELKRLLVSLSCGQREENTSVDREKAEKDAQDIYEAGESQMGTDESVFSMVLVNRSFPQLRATFDMYNDIAGKDIEDSIHSETRGVVEDGLITIVQFAKSSDRYFAENIHNSLQGIGTDEKALLRTVITRSDIDLANIAREYEELFGDSLSSAINSELGGELGQLMAGVVGNR